MKPKAVIIGLVLVVALGAGGYVIFHKSGYKAPSSDTQNQTGQTQTQNDTSNQNQGTQNAADTITYSDNGFSPAQLNVSAGTTVTVKNTTSGDVEMDSDPHPVHTDDTDLNVGLVAAGQSKTFTVTKKGTFGYHNHLDPSQQAKITIE